MTQFTLRANTPEAWLQAVLDDFDTFLQDHAAAEKKAAGMALSMISHYPDRLELVETMADIAVEEMSHFREVIKWLHRRNVQLAADVKDDYIHQLRACIRQGSDVYLLDRLLTGSIIEARGHERFALVAEGLDTGPLKQFYIAIAKSEARHYQTFLQLAHRYYPSNIVNQRLETLLDDEARIVKSLPIHALLH
ncbi:tRNA-(ms[2]io[6]A)-hydroxylase [bacterium]|nr:tRNA-(ms[2]io[6]A)-hydroxylase [bacterium]